MLEHVYKKLDDIVSRDIADETIIVPIKGKLADMQKIFSIDAVGEYIWNHLNGRNSLNDLCGGIVYSFNVDKKQVEMDIVEFVNELLDAGLISQVE